MEGEKTLWLQGRRCTSLFSSSLIPKQRNRQGRDDERDATCDSEPRPSPSEGCCSTAPARCLCQSRNSTKARPGDG